MKYIVDTNIVIRLLTNDDEKQVHTLLNVIKNGNLKLILSSSVVIESCWVLNSYYKFSNQEVAEAMQLLLVSEEIIIEEPFIQEVLSHYGDQQLDIVDVYLSIKSKHTNTPVLTWDKGFRKLDCEYYKPEDLLES